jgi:peptidoglycan/LPS O-acetylase OafA/YrhL
MHVFGFDLFRGGAILFVALAHVILFNVESYPVIVAFLSLTPVILMCALGLLSGLVIAMKSSRNTGEFLVRRSLRLFAPTTICLLFAASLHLAYGLPVNIEHLILQLLGFAGFFDLLQVQNNSSVGWGLWFVTTIFACYLAFPIFLLLFQHRNAGAHFTLIWALCFTLFLALPRDSSIWVVVVGFALGVFIACQGGMRALEKLPLLGWVGLAAAAVAGSAFSILVDMPVLRQGLGPVGALAFIAIFAQWKSPRSKRLRLIVGWFSAISYEFYILHFYFINTPFNRMFGAQPLLVQILVGFALTAALAHAAAYLAHLVTQRAEEYFFSPATQGVYPRQRS